MEAHVHTLALLFDQLGIDSSDEGIEKFIIEHAGLPAEKALYEASYWSSSQSAFLKQAKSDDSDWAEIVDRLDAMLR